MVFDLKYNRLSVSDLKNHDIACTLGHVHMWRDFINSDDNERIFIEDDAILHNDGELLLRRQLNEARNNNYDVLLLHSQRNLLISTRKLITGYNYLYVDIEPIRSAMCYVLTKKAVSKILEYHELCAADTLIYRASLTFNLKVFIGMPFPVISHAQSLRENGVYS